MHDEPNLIGFATTALACHRDTELTSDQPLTRVELDALHEHAVTLHVLLDQATVRTRAHAAAEGDQLHHARIRMWQVSEHLHAAYHVAPAPTGARPPARPARSACPKARPTSPSASATSRPPPACGRSAPPPT